MTSSNLDNAYKLIEIVKGVDKINMMQDGEGYSRDRYSRDMEDYSRDGYSRDDYDSGNSYRRGRNQRNGQYMHRPNYSRLSGDDTDMDRYREMKRQYSNARDRESKEKMLDSLSFLVGNICDSVAQIFRDCDCPEEREIIMDNIDELYRKIKR